MQRCSEAAATDRLAPTRNATRPAARQRQLPDARIRGGEVSLRPPYKSGRLAASLHHSGLMLAAWITLPHFSVYSTMYLPNSAGEFASGTTPKSARRAFIFGSVRAALIALLRVSMISADVLLGAAMPTKPLAS